jgi:glycosyltransferase involved in cell wall biosynthesis
MYSEMNVLFFWEPVGGLTLKHRCNPYGPLLARALAKLDVHLELGEGEFALEWLEEKRRDFQVLHLNWLHYFYRDRDLESTVARCARFAENLAQARRMGYRIVWTLHNRYPHERPFPQVDHLARLMVCRLAHAVMAHCQHAASLAPELFHWEGPVQVIPHGNFIDAFPNQVSRQQARQKLGLGPEAFVYLFFGNARNYKGIERLLEAFRTVAAADARLVLMMRQAFNPQYAQELKQMAGGDERIMAFTSDYFPNEEFQFFLNAADVTVLPFAEILTSGSAITSLSFGKPVILPRLGCLPELIDPGEGLLYDPQDPQGLEKAMGEIRGRDLGAMGKAAYDKARSLDWDAIAAQVAAMYRG